MKIKITIFLFFIVGQLTAQGLYFPPNNGQWATVSTSNYNWCTTELDSLQQFLDNTDTKAFIILKDGKIAVEWYFDNFTQDSLWYWASAGKSLTATLVGIAQEEGYLNIHDSTAKYLENWTNCSPNNAPQITIKNQLSMTTGLDDGISNSDCTDPICLSCLATPNTRWAYHNAPYTLLESVVEAATGVSYNAYLYSKINLKIGTNILYVPLGYNRVAISKTRDVARFGLLTLAKGNWNGTAVYSDTTYYHNMVNSSQNLNPAYGYLWWLNGKNKYMLPSSQFVFNGKLVPNAPDDMFAALGKNDQKIYVVPSENMVVVRLGNTAGISLLAVSNFDNQLWEKISDLDCSTHTQKIIDELETVTISPNPTNGLLFINNSKTVDYVLIFTALGTIVRQEKLDYNTLNIQDLDNGFYFIKIYFKDGNSVVKRIFKNSN